MKKVLALLFGLTEILMALSFFIVLTAKTVSPETSTGIIKVATLVLVLSAFVRFVLEDWIREQGEKFEKFVRNLIRYEQT